MSNFGTVDPVQVATQVVRDYCGWHVAPSEEHELTLDGTGTDLLLLPSRRVNEILSVSVNGQDLNPDQYEWSATGALRRKGGVWPSSYRSIEVKLNHGHADMTALSGVVGSIAARIQMDPTGVVVTQRAGTQQVSYSSQSSMGHGLMGTEKEALAPYKLNWGP